MEAPTPKEIFILQQKIYFEGKNYTLKLSNPNLSEIQIKIFKMILYLNMKILFPCNNYKKKIIILKCLIQLMK